MNESLSKRGGWLDLFLVITLLSAIAGFINLLLITFFKSNSVYMELQGPGFSIAVFYFLANIAIAGYICYYLFKEEPSSPRKIKNLLVLNFALNFIFGLLAVLFKMNGFYVSLFALFFGSIIYTFIWTEYFRLSERVRSVYKITGDVKKSVLDISLSDGTEVKEQGLNPAVIVIIAVVVILSIIPFIKNYKLQDNHLNWLNHDYAKNLLICTEQDSIFMTEGGDNQVFGSLYFTYAEKLRPDITPYDQKGNIFKKIYGDMRYAYPEPLQMTVNLVDSHLFASEEPFHTYINDDISYFKPSQNGDKWLMPTYRGQDELSFVPYWQGHRPVYLTWQRPNPGTLGDYYYKRYGIMYKVQDIAYYLVDYLEIKKEIPLSEAQQQLSAQLARQVDIPFTVERIRRMVKEGYLSFNGSSVKYVKMYDAPHKGNYFDKLILRWKEIPNVQYWDFLSREIIINYLYTMGEIYRDDIEKLKQMSSRESRPDVKADIMKRMKEDWQKAKENYEEALKYGGDSLGTLHNTAIVYMKNEMEDLGKEAHELLVKAVTYYPMSWSSYYMIFNYLVRDILKNPDHEKANLAEADHWMDQIKKNMLLNHTVKGDYKKHENWNNFAGFEGFLGQFKQIPTAQLIALQNDLLNQISHSPDKIDPKMAVQAIFLTYSRGTPFQYEPYIQKGDELLSKTYGVLNNNYDFVSAAFYNIALQMQKTELAYQLGKDMIRLKPNLSDTTFYYYFGMICNSMSKPQETKIYLNRFLDLINQDRQAVMQYKGPIDNAKKILENLK